MPLYRSLFSHGHYSLSVIQRFSYPGSRVLVHPGKQISRSASSVLILKTALLDNKMSFREAGKNEKSVSRNYTIKNKPWCDHLFVPNLRCSLFHLVDENTLRQTQCDIVIIMGCRAYNKTVILYPINRILSYKEKQPFKRTIFNTTTHQTTNNIHWIRSKNTLQYNMLLYYYILLIILYI